MIRAGMHENAREMITPQAIWRATLGKLSAKFLRA